MWLTPRPNRAFAGFLHPEMQRQKRIAGTEDIRVGSRAQKSGAARGEERHDVKGNEEEKGGSTAVYSCAMYSPFWPQPAAYIDYDCELYSEDSFLVFWSSTSSVATRYGLQTTEPKVPMWIICCRHARIRTRADSHDGCTHVIGLKVDGKNTPLRNHKSLRSKDLTNQEAEPRVERKQMSFGQPQLRCGSFEALRRPAVPGSFKDQSSTLTVATL
ncbi:hypothetical protein ALC56_15154 [Trachymyrmex septentrionalis]|uniref:Uncharacterized protein n=1 Tax=Trachymyrmex septentrionalis TaxID=34720 RepID=A0A195EQH0_9HYME|nr:hypothetical protein ALC56_15154 [Trachymyrmex septentrionalis]